MHMQLVVNGFKKCRMIIKNKHVISLTIMCVYISFSFPDRVCSRPSSSSRLQHWSGSCNSNFQVRNLSNIFPCLFLSSCHCYNMSVMMSRIHYYNQTFSLFRHTTRTEHQFILLIMLVHSSLWRKVPHSICVEAYRLADEYVEFSVGC